MTLASDILSVAPKNASELLGSKDADIKARFRTLLKEWHPDHNKDPDAAKVCDHLVILKATAIRIAALKTPGAKVPRFPGQTRDYVTRDGDRSRVSYLRKRAGDLGDILVTETSLVYEYGTDFDDVSYAEIAAVDSLRYADDRMREEIARYMPKRKRSLRLADRTVLFYERPADTILLADLAAHYDGKIPAAHVAWIVSSLMNLCCFLEWAGFVHGAILPETLLICPSKHSVSLVGGWGFATEIGRRPTILPRRTTDVVPRLAVAGELITTRVDIDLIKATAQEILGSAGGTGLKLNKEIPLPMIEWLLSPSSDDAGKEYRGWMASLTDAYGKRKFVDMNVIPADVYATPQAQGN